MKKFEAEPGAHGRPAPRDKRAEVEPEGPGRRRVLFFLRCPRSRPPALPPRPGLHASRAQAGWRARAGPPGAHRAPRRQYRPSPGGTRPALAE